MNPGSFVSSIQLVEKRFSGALRPDQNGDLYVAHSASEDRFVGTSSQDVESNWDKLISGRNVPLLVILIPE